jgi:hypothetical protein
LRTHHGQPVTKSPKKLSRKHLSSVSSQFHVYMLAQPQPKFLNPVNSVNPV